MTIRFLLKPVTPCSLSHTETQEDTTALATQTAFNLFSLFCLPLCCLPPMPTSQLLGWKFFVLPFYRTCLFSLLLSPSLVDTLNLREKELLGRQDGSGGQVLAAQASRWV